MGELEARPLRSLRLALIPSTAEMSHEPCVWHPTARTVWIMDPPGCVTEATQPKSVQSMPAEGRVKVCVWQDRRLWENPRSRASSVDTGWVYLGVLPAVQRAESDHCRVRSLNRSLLHAHCVRSTVRMAGHATLQMSLSSGCHSQLMLTGYLNGICPVVGSNTTHCICSLVNSQNEDYTATASTCMPNLKNSELCKTKQWRSEKNGTADCMFHSHHVFIEAMNTHYSIQTICFYLW